MQSAVAAQPVPPSIGHGSVAVTTGETNKPAPNIVVVEVVVAAATAVAAVVIKARGRRLDFLIVVTTVVVMVVFVCMNCYLCVRSFGFGA